MNATQRLCMEKMKINNSAYEIVDDDMTDEKYDVFGGHLARRV